MKTFLSLVSGLTLGLSVASASAQEIEEIVVTADLLNRSLQDLAASVSVIDDAEIEERGAQHLEQLLNLAPNVNFSSGASRGRYIQIRGIGERSEFVEPLNSSVGVTLDGIDLTGISTVASTLDIQQVEVLRGPQGTVYGANALAGLINLRSTAPTDGLGGKLKAEVGNYGALNYSGILNAPLSDQVGLRVSAMQTQSDGYIENSYLNRDDTNNIDETSVKAKLVWQVSDALSLDLTGLHADVENGYDAFSFDNNRVTLSDTPGHDRQETDAFSLQANWILNDTLTLETLLSAATSDVEYGYDEDWSYVGLCEGLDCDSDNWGFDWEYSSTDNYLRENDTLTLDVRLRSAENAGEMGWVGGVYYRDQDRTLLRQWTYDADFSTRFDTENLALYGEIDFPLNDKLVFSSGLRFETYEGDYSDNRGESASPDENLWGGKVSLNYQFSDTHSAYGLISRGYKTGGFNANSSLEPEFQSYDTEFLWNYEFGLKGLWLNGRMDTRVAVFHQDREDIQIATSFVVPLSGVDGDPCPCNFVEYTDNAAEASSYGLELETWLQATESLALFLSLGVLDADFDSYINYAHVDADSDTGSGVDMAGHELPHAPAYMFHTGLDWAITEAISLQISSEAKDEFFLSDGHEEKSDSYVLAHARLNYELDSLLLSLWGRNLTDEDVIVRGFGSFGNDPRNYYETEPYYQYGEPRLFGVSGTYSF